MVENVFKRPPYAQFKYEQKLQKQNAETFGAVVGYWQKELCTFYKMSLTDKGYDLVVLEMFLEQYNDAIRSANTPEEVTALYEHFVKTIKLSKYVIRAAENYAKQIAEQITELEETPVCPCCSGYISPEFIDELKMRYDDLQEQIKFYEMFTQQRCEDMERLSKKVQSKEIKVEIWQVPGKMPWEMENNFPMHFRVVSEDDESESSGVGQ